MPLWKAEIGSYPFSTQKTLYLFKRGSDIKEIAKARAVKESTVWEHLAKLIEHNQLQLSKVLAKDKISKILQKIRNENDRLTDIKIRIEGTSIALDEINCVLASLKGKRKKGLKTPP